MDPLKFKCCMTAIEIKKMRKTTLRLFLKIDEKIHYWRTKFCYQIANWRFND